MSIQFIDQPITKAMIIQQIESAQASLGALGVKRVGLFGSFVRGEQRPDSDVDILVECETGRKTFKNFMQVSFLLEELLQRNLDIVTLESLSPYIGPHILREVEYVNGAD